MSLGDEYEDRLQRVMQNINNGEEPESSMEDIANTFNSIAQTLNSAFDILNSNAILGASSGETTLETTNLVDDFEKYFGNEKPEFVYHVPDAGDAVVANNTLDEVLKELYNERSMCWQMAEIYLRKKDARGLHDVGLEIQTIDKAINEIEKIKR